MSRVIQDSDDELDDDLEVEVQQAEAKDASPKQFASDASSTEALRRQIEAAHRAHLQSQFPMTDNQTSAALENNHQKRKAPPDFDSYSKNTASKKPTITYTKKAKGMLDSSPGYLHHDQNLMDQLSQPADQLNETNWILEDTMREAYAHHNPNAMFPEPSSTVPNATLTQQRVLEGVLGPALLGSEADAGRTSFHPDASIPWSEYLKSPTNTGEQPKSSAQHSQVSQHTVLPTSVPSLNDGSDLPISQSNRRESLTLVGCPLTEDKSTGIVNDHQNFTVFPVDEIAVQTTLPQATPFSAASETTRGKAPNSSRSPRKTKRVLSPDPTSDDDLADLGLPKEQYKPRPSRSRSLKTGTQESLDYSVRPEKATKANRRRKSTPASTSVASPLSTPDRIQQICEMGFTPFTSAKALKQNNGDVTQSVDWLIANGVANDELLSHTSQMSRDDTQQSVPNIDINGYDSDLKAGHILDSHAMPMEHGTGSKTTMTSVATAAANDTSSLVDIKSPTKVQVVIPAKSPLAVAEMAAPEVPRKKTKRKNTTLDQSKATAVDDAVTEAKAEKKRGRGRPKKTAKTASSTELVHKEAEGPGEQMRDTTLNSIDGNARPILVQPQVVEDTEIANTTKPVQAGSSATENTRSVNATSRSTPEPQGLPDRPEVEPITPKRVKKTAPREQPSSNKAKVPYRVGLSKRTRIAPLLRVIKK